MERFLTLALAGTLSFLSLHAQTCDIVVFSDMGDKFTLMVDGAEVNATPASRVVASSIRNETPSLLVRFADAAKAPIKQNGYFPLGKEYTAAVTTTEKGQMVLRLSGEAELGTASRPRTQSPSRPPSWRMHLWRMWSEEAVDMNDGADHHDDDTVVEEWADGVNDMEGENVNMSFGGNGKGVNMNGNVNGQMGTGNHNGYLHYDHPPPTTTKVTHTGKAGRSRDHHQPETTAVLEPVYKMPGYSGPIGVGRSDYRERVRRSQGHHLQQELRGHQDDPCEAFVGGPLLHRDIR